MRSLILASVLTSTGLISACAHPLVISPDISQIVPEPSTQPIKKNVGYYISADKRALEVTTPGGGGDKVNYHPYADTETAFYKMLSTVFSNVTVLNSANDAEALGKGQLSYIIVPTFSTNSSSSGLVTWMPTDFSFQLSCNVSTASGVPVTNDSVNGKGHADTGELLKDFSLSGKRSAQDALLKSQRALLNDPKLRN